MRIASYNIHHGMDVKMQMDVIGRDIADVDADVVRMVINEENQRLVATLVRELDDIYRDVILLKFEQEMTTKEIAKFLNITDDLVRMRYMRARRLLQQLLFMSRPARPKGPIFT